MKKYSFRLERILQIKEHEESEAKLAYAAVLQKKLNLEKQNEMLTGDLSSSYKEDFDSLKPGDRINMLSIQGQSGFERGVGLRIAENNRQKMEVEKELEPLLEKLKEKVKEKKKYEKLKEHDYREYKDFVKKEEIKVLDDIGTKESELMMLSKSKKT